MLEMPIDIDAIVDRVQGVVRLVIVVEAVLEAYLVIDIIDVDGNTGLQSKIEVALTDTANVDRRGLRPAQSPASGRQSHRGRTLRDILDIRLAACLHHL